MPQDFVLPDGWRSWAAQKRTDLDIAEEAEKFVDYWHSKAGAEACRKDWAATWRNWIRNAYHRQPGQANTRHPVPEPPPDSTSYQQTAGLTTAPAWLEEPA